MQIKVEEKVPSNHAGMKNISGEVSIFDFELNEYIL